MTFTQVRHSEFYMESVIFLVEDILFKVPRYQFERSPVFATVFTLPSGKLAVAEGKTDENPFKLEGISKADFETFLRVVYPMGLLPSQIVMGVDEWISVLKLSTMWEFQETRKLAIQTLSSGIDLTTKILLGKQYKVGEWLFAAYEGLVKRTEPISVDEAERLGLETAIRLYQIREEGAAEIPRKRTKRTTVSSGLGQNAFGNGMFHSYPVESHYQEVGPIIRDQDDYTQKIWREFSEELKEVGEME